ncbi:MAG: threonine--tRNA ligase, partial [Nanoarchaeota archaeon]|nr:threonine--tRNA ligase [Nanoarchaeota archaeon]
MKILTIHSDFLEFEAKKKAFKKAEEGIKEGLQRMEECLVVFTAVEKVDENNVDLAVDRYIEEIEKVLGNLNAKNIVLYPYAHLSSELASPEIAVKILKKAEKELKKFFSVTRAPFGYYKEFELKVKGHP